MAGEDAEPAFVSAVVCAGGRGVPLLVMESEAEYVSDQLSVQLSVNGLSLPVLSYSQRTESSSTVLMFAGELRTSPRTLL